jgi:hypothetical protein
VNTFFGSNFSSSDVALALWQAQGAPLNNDCSAQALLVDVAPVLSPTSAPNRTAWAQAALLWSAVQSQNTTQVAALRKAVAGAPWTTLGGDGPVAGAAAAFRTTQLGYAFDFAAQTVAEPPQTFAAAGQASSTQMGRLGNEAQSALDRMYTYAIGAVSSLSTRRLSLT